MSSDSTIACLLVNLPTRNRYQSVAKRARWLERRVEKLSGWPIALLTPEATLSQVAHTLQQASSASDIDLLVEPNGNCLDPQTNEFVGTAPLGSFSVVVQLFESGVILKYLEIGVQYLYLSFIGNLEAELSPAVLGLIALQDNCDLFPEITEWQVRDDGPVLLPVQGGERLFEREELPEESAGEILGGQFQPSGTATNTYYIRLSGLLSKLELTADSIKERTGTGYFRFALERFTAPLYLRKQLPQGKEVLCPDLRVSQLTRLLRTLYLKGAPREYLAQC